MHSGLWKWKTLIHSRFTEIGLTHEMFITMTAENVSDFLYPVFEAKNKANVRFAMRDFWPVAEGVQITNAQVLGIFASASCVRMIQRPVLCIS